MECSPAQPDIATEQFARGLDGLTTEQLRASRQGWWDEYFTRFLLERLPSKTLRILDVGCGLATAAHALLPFLENTTYIGIDADDNRLYEAEKLLAGTAYASRVALQRGRAEQLPFLDGAADFVLCSMTLQHVPNVRVVLSEIMRVLCPAGRFVAIEPDNLANQFYFDGVLQKVNEAFRDLFAAQREARRPADTAIGPALPSMLGSVGFKVIDCRPYALGRVSRILASEFFSRARHVAEIACAAANLSPDSSTMQHCLAAINEAVAEVGTNNVGYGCQLVPVFVTVTEKSE